MLSQLAGRPTHGAAAGARVAGERAHRAAADEQPWPKLDWHEGCLLDIVSGTAPAWPG
jgi:hypothetical protein